LGKLFCIAWFLLSVAVLFGSLARAASDLNVCPSCSFTTIQAAVAQARDGDTIKIAPGVYHESQILLSHSVRLLGTGMPTVDGGGHGTIFLLRADKIEISGLRIQDSGFSYVDDLAGIKVEKGNDCIIRGNELLRDFFAIHIGESRGCIVEGNRIEGPDRIESASANGIHVWHAQNLTVRGNTVSKHRDGIYFEFVTDSSIVDNRSEGNLRYGLHFMFSSGNSYVGNVFSKNDSGVAVMYSKNITMERNRFERSWGGSAFGILLKEISASKIRNNVFIENTVGAYLEGTTRSTLEDNVFQSNGWGIRILGDSDGNQVVHNDFIDNTFDVSTNASISQNTFSENFWSDYAGIDLNHDGIGDMPFHPVKLSSVLMEKLGVSVLLLKSFFFTVADDAESLFPVLTPDSLRDDRPLMKRRSAL
jgi:nitrous oxidase accessory protein